MRKRAFYYVFWVSRTSADVPGSAGAEGGTRTLTLLRAADFESAASTDSATSARIKRRSMRHSVDRVERQLPFATLVIAGRAGLRLVHATAGDGLGVHVQADRHRAAAGIADGVVLVRRDQTAGRTGAGDEGCFGVEAPACGIVRTQRVTGDLQLALPDALDAPQAGVIVDAGALARSPGHRHDAVDVARAAIQLAPRIAITQRGEDRGGQLQALIAHELTQTVAQARGQRLGVVGAERGIDAIDQ